jgi:molybdopterin/thiamine biosynthesis adenylyltransferase
MDNRYSRNRIYVSNEEQEIIKKFPILLAGSGIGSVIAECALRFGFETITIIDGDQVELSNLNRQNYTEEDISTNKVESIEKRLKAINSNAKINCINLFLTNKNVGNYIKGHGAAINALDFSTDIPLIFDFTCQKFNIPVLHPYNIGWGSLVTVISKDGLPLDSLSRPNEDFNELNVVKYASSYLRFWGDPQGWLEKLIKDYNPENKVSPPQLSIASWSVAAMCTHILFNIATGRNVKQFPEFYFSTIMEC